MNTSGSSALMQSAAETRCAAAVDINNQAQSTSWHENAAVLLSRHRSLPRHTITKRRSSATEDSQRQRHWTCCDCADMSLLSSCVHDHLIAGTLKPAAEWYPAWMRYRKRDDNYVFWREKFERCSLDIPCESNLRATPAVHRANSREQIHTM